jgi:dTDP-4-dehydrorhamnose 3,5-epimerase
MSYASFTNPGVIRGPHEHVAQSDCFVFLGPGSFQLHLWDRRESSSTNGEKMEIIVGEDSPTLVIVPPGVVHGYKCVSEIPALSLNFPDKLYRGEGKKEEIDEIRWEKDPESPYKIS